MRIKKMLYDCQETIRHRNKQLQVTVRPSTMSKANTAKLAMKGPEMTILMLNNSNEKTDSLILYVQKMNEKQI